MAEYFHLGICAICPKNIPRHAIVYKNNNIQITSNIYTNEMCVEFIDKMLQQNTISEAWAERLRGQIPGLNLPLNYEAFLLTLPAEEKNRLEKAMNEEPSIEQCPCNHPLFHIKICVPNKKLLGQLLTDGCFFKDDANMEINRMLNKLKIISKEQANKLRADVNALALPQTEEEYEILLALALAKKSKTNLPN